MEEASDKVWMPSKAYVIGRRYIDFCIRRSYRNLCVKGLENIPGGAVIFAPNHTNTIMDPLILLQCFKSPTMFGARADMFSNKSLARLMTFFRIVPMVRAKDGLRNVEHNRSTMDVVCRGLEHGVPFCIFPEGTHRAQEGLLPLKKGIYRIAAESGAPVVPVAICYSDFFRFRGNCTIKFGKPIDATAFDDPREMLSTLSEKMIALQEPVAGPAKMPKAIALPLRVIAGAVAFPQLIAAHFLVGMFKDKAWANSMRFLCKFILAPLTVLVWFIVFLICPSVITGALLLFSPFAQSLFYDTL